MTRRSSRRALVAIIATLGLALVTTVGAAALESLPGTKASTASMPGPAPAQARPDHGSRTPGAGAERRTSEVLPAPDEKSPIGLPPSPPLPDLVPRPLPPTASKTGALVAGYPAKIIPPSPNATVVSSSVASAENRLQVTLTANTPMAPAAVLNFYRVTFAANNLVDSVAPAAAGSRALLFSRGTDTVLITVTPMGPRGTSYSVFGVLTAKT